MNETCTHENTEQLAKFDHGYRGSKDRRSYEVFICLDCGTILNYSQGNEPADCIMKPLEIVQMFVDLRSITEDAAYEIEEQAKSIREAVEGLAEKMPKAATK